MKDGEEHRQQLGQMELEVAAERDRRPVEQLDAVPLQLLARFLSRLPEPTNEC